MSFLESPNCNAANVKCLTVLHVLFIQNKSRVSHNETWIKAEVHPLIWGKADTRKKQDTCIKTQLQINTEHRKAVYRLKSVVVLNK